MVFFKVNRLLARLIGLTEFNGRPAIGCSKLCDKQYISLEDINIGLDIIQRKASELMKKLENQEILKEVEQAEKSEKSKKQPKTKEEIAESMRLMQLQAKALSIKKMKPAEVQAAKKELAELDQFTKMKATEIGQLAEMLMGQGHLCNNGIQLALKSKDGCLKMKNPKTGMVHLIKSAKDVIDFNEAAQTTLTEQNSINPESEKDKEQRLKENEKVIKKCKAKAEMRLYHKLTGNIAGFSNQSDLEKRHQNQETQFTLTFGFGMITLMFLGFVSGYFLGRRILGLDPLPSIFVSIVVGVVTIMVEMLLMIFRISKFDKMQAMERKRLKLD